MIKSQAYCFLRHSVYGRRSSARPPASAISSPLLFLLIADDAWHSITAFRDVRCSPFIGTYIISSRPKGRL